MAKIEPAAQIALVVGNGAYEKVPSLLNPGNDARAVGAALERLGFVVKYLEDAGYVDMLQGLLGFSQAAQSARAAVVFYAGHGAAVDGRNFLIPVDARGAAFEADLDLDSDRHVTEGNIGWVPVTWLVRSVSGASHLRLVFLDADVSVPLEPAGGTIVAQAAAAGSSSMDGDTESGHSPYTGALLRYLEEPELELGMLFRKVRHDVMRATDGAQEPVVYGLPGHEVYFDSLAGGDTSSSPSPPTGAAAKELFEEAKALGTIAAYRIVAEGFPGSIYAKLAQAWIDKHEQAPVVVAGGEAVDEAAAPPSAPSSEAVERGLKLSEKERKLIQKGLVAAEHDPGPVDGVIGSGTREAIRLWQKSKGLEVTGYLTRGQLEELVALSAPDPEAVERGLWLSDEQRRLIQKGLVAAGHDPGFVDGIIDLGMRRALRAWQKSKGLDVTGYLTRGQSEELGALRLEEGADHGMLVDDSEVGGLGDRAPGGS